MAGSGWCHHPLRKTTNELLIMVRRNELACRDQWSHSLWEEGTWEPTSAEAGRSADSVEAGRALQPATEGDIAALLRAGQAERPAPSARASQEDVVLGEARLVSDRTPSWRREDPPAEPRRDYDPRTAIKKAREAYRERMRSQEAARSALADESPLAIDAAGASAGEPSMTVDATEMVGDRGDAEVRFVRDANDLVATDERLAVTTQREPIEVADGSDEGASDGDADASDSVNGPNGDALETDWWTAGDAGPDAPFATWAEPAEEATARADPAPTAEALPESAALSPDWSAGWFLDDAAPPAATEIASSPWSVASAANGSTPGGLDTQTDDWWDNPAAGMNLSGVAAPRDEEWSGADPADRHGADAWLAEFAGHEFSGSGGDAAVSPVDVSSAEVVPAEAPPERLVIPLLPAGSVAPGVPRICRTCRDFRPAEGSDRGWCANQWAFTARQMVYPEDPAPCETSAGSWWLPTDELCLADADVSTHGQPTPHLDRWLPHHRERVAERKRS